MYEQFCLDIETANAEPTEVERWARLHWSPNANWKPETIGARYLDALAKKRERLALLDASPVICVSIKTEHDLRCLHAMGARQPELRSGGLVEGFADERTLLAALRHLLESGCDDGTCLIGHNIKHFDLPKLRQAYLRNKLRVPYALVNRDQPVFDTMLEYGRHFSLEKDLFISAADLAEVLGLSNHKSLVDGAAVPELYAAGKVDPIVTYALLDALLEHNIFLRMTGLDEDDGQTPNGSPVKAPNATVPAPTTVAAAGPAGKIDDSF